MLDYYVARTQLLESIKNLNQQFRYEEIALNNAVGRHLAEAVIARFDQPLFTNSAMDGYAVCDPEGKYTHFDCIERIAAGEIGTFTLQPGQAARIFTGAAIPEGATGVVMQEKVKCDQNQITVTTPVQINENMRLRGEEVQVGQVIVPANTKITPVVAGILASQGYTVVKVKQPLRVAVISTGSELQELGEDLQSGKIYDTNRYLLMNWLKQMDVKVIDGGIVTDHLSLTIQILDDLADKVDVIIASGGASVGEEDHLKQAIHHLGQLEGWQLAIKPGKPFGFGKIRKAGICLLPGNPVASLVTFYLLVYPYIKNLQSDDSCLLNFELPAYFTREKLEPRREFLRGNYFIDDQGQRWVKPLAQQGSHMLTSMIEATVLIEIPPSQSVKHGQLLKVYPLPF